MNEDRVYTEDEVQQRLAQEKRLQALETEVATIKKRLGVVEDSQIDLKDQFLTHENEQALAAQATDTLIAKVADGWKVHLEWHKQQVDERGKGFYKFRDIIGVINTSIGVIVFLVVTIGGFAIWSDRQNQLHAQSQQTTQGVVK